MSAPAIADSQKIDRESRLYKLQFDSITLIATMKPGVQGETALYIRHSGWLHGSQKPQ